MDRSRSTCNLCGAHDAAWTREIRDHSDRSASYQLVKCKRCALVYLHPQPGAMEVLARSAGYQAMMDEMMLKLRGSRVGRLGLRKMRDAHVPPTATRGRALDIGCWQGDYLARLRGFGWETHGIEMDGGAAQHARDVYGLDVTTGRAEEKLGDFADGSFDLVTMWHVLEHVGDPSLVLAEVHRVLKPGGTLLLAVPNWNSVWARVLGQYWYSLEPPFHLYHFSPRTLRRLLGKTGFRLTQTSTQPAPGAPMWSFQMLWHGLRGTCWDGHLLWSPTLAVLLYPIELLLAQIGRSNHLHAVAVK